MSGKGSLLSSVSFDLIFKNFSEFDPVRDCDKIRGLVLDFLQASEKETFDTETNPIVLKALMESDRKIKHLVMKADDGLLNVVFCAGFLMCRHMWTDHNKKLLETLKDLEAKKP